MHFRVKTVFFFMMFALILGLNLYIFSGMFHTLAFAAIITGCFYPLFNWVHKRFKLSRSVASLITTLVIILTVAIPMVYLVAQVSREAVTLYQSMQADFGQNTLQSYFTEEKFVGRTALSVIELLKLEMSLDDLYHLTVQRVQEYSGSFLKIFNSLVGDTIEFLFQFALMLLACYALFISGDRLKEFLFQLSPLPDTQEQLILDRFNQMNYATLVGNGIGGIIQGTLAGIAFWIAGIPSVFLWTTVMIILAFIPIVGMSIVFIPASIYLFLNDEVFWGVFLLVWCGAVSVVVENWYKPKFVGERVQVDNIALLFYVLAGMATFGAAGIFYGPILLIIFLTVSEFFTSYYLINQSRS